MNELNLVNVTGSENNNISMEILKIILFQFYQNFPVLIDVDKVLLATDIISSSLSE